jgi:hypothetical protein
MYLKHGIKLHACLGHKEGLQEADEDFAMLRPILVGAKARIFA